MWIVYSLTGEKSSRPCLGWLDMNYPTTLVWHYCGGCGRFHQPISAIQIWRYYLQSINSPSQRHLGAPEELSHICNISGGGEGMTGEVGHITWNTKVVDQHEEVVATVWCCIPIPAGQLSCKLLCSAMIDWAAEQLQNQGVGNTWVGKYPSISAATVWCFVPAVQLCTVELCTILYYYTVTRNKNIFFKRLRLPLWGLLFCL